MKEKHFFLFFLYPVSVIGKQGFRTKENMIRRFRPAVLISAGLRTNQYPSV